MKCKHIKMNGEQCRANAMSESELCFRHNPTMKEFAVEVSASGGKSNKHNTSPLKAQIKLKKPKDVTKLLEQTINELREGSITPKIATSIGYLSSQIIKAMEVNELDKRLEALEQQQKEVKHES